MVTLYDAKGGIQAGLADYWNGVFQRRATASLKGIQAAVSALTVNILPNTTAFGLDLIIDATVDADLYADQFDTIIISPATKGKLQKQEKNSYVPASQTNIGFDTWAGYKIIVDKTFGDNMSVVARSGALAFGTGTPAGMVPFEVERIANGGNGQGGDILHSRQSVVLHPQGFNYKGGVSPTEAATTGNLAHSGSWELAVDKQYVPFRFFAHDVTGG
ncbi:hypothetical protein ATN00_17930 [Sphingobium baderi]|uniref:Uncharacterized protein n=1 Tax=Sphingobium baderi TaxID=1332080 RepID=A0A0S3F2M9_9SPHN|nr:hypothetical protein ATN00_17930 [Sphingobium baderi]